MTTTMPSKQLFLLGLLIALAAVNICAYTPALPYLSHFFHQDIRHTQLLVVASLFGNAIASILFAILANRLSILFSLSVGLSLCLLGDCFAIISYKLLPFFPVLVIGILLLSLGGNVGMVIALTLLRESYSKQLVSYTAISMISFAILPGVAILTAGFLVMQYTWVAIFIALAIYHVLLFYACRQLPITNLKDSPKAIFSITILRQPYFLSLMCMAGVLSGMTYSFTAQSPHIAIDQLSQTPFAFGAWSNLLSLGMLIGLLLAWRLNNQFSFPNTVRCSIIIIAGALLIGLSHTSIIIFYFYSTIISIATQLSYPYVTSEAMRIQHNYPSSAALFNIGHTLIASAFVWSTNHFGYASYHNLWMSYLFGMVLLWICYWMVRSVRAT